MFAANFKNKLCGSQIFWVNLEFHLKSLHFFCDDIGKTYLHSNPVFHSRVKHIALDYHFVRQQVQNGKLIASHIYTNDQLAYILTKLLHFSKFSHLKEKIGVVDCDIILRGNTCIIPFLLNSSS